MSYEGNWMSNRTLVELNHDYCPLWEPKALQSWAEQMVSYMTSGDETKLPKGVTFKHIRHHSEPDPEAGDSGAEKP